MGFSNIFGLICIGSEVLRFFSFSSFINLPYVFKISYDSSLFYSYCLSFSLFFKILEAILTKDTL